MPYMVVVSDIGQERDCRKSVKAAGFACYMPSHRELIVKQGRKVWTERLLFGRYFFAKWFVDCDWRSLPNLRHVRGLFMRVDAEQPSLVRDAEIEHLRSMEDDHGYVTGVARNGLTKGQKIRATLGVMAGSTGIYVGSGKGGCDIALLELLGRQTRIEFAPGVLQAA